MIIKKKSVKRIIALVSAAAIVVTAGCIRNYRSVQAITYTNALIQEKQQEIERANAERTELAGRVTDLSASQGRLESLKSDLNAYVSELDAELLVMQDL